MLSEAAIKSLHYLNILFQEVLSFAVALFNALMNLSLVCSGSISEWNGLVKLHVKRSMYMFFSILILITINDWTWYICTNYLKWSYSCSSVWRNNALLLCCEWFGIESFACKTFSDYSLCYLLQPRNQVIFPDNSHCKYDSPMHCSLVSFIDDFLSL